MSRWAVVIHRHLDGYSMEKAHKKNALTLDVVHSTVFFDTETKKPITFPSVEEAYEYAKKQTNTLPPSKYAFSLIRVTHGWK